MKPLQLSIQNNRESDELVGGNDKYVFTAEQNPVETSDFQERSVY